MCVDGMNMDCLATLGKTHGTDRKWVSFHLPVISARCAQIFGNDASAEVFYAGGGNVFGCGPALAAARPLVHR